MEKVNEARMQNEAEIIALLDKLSPEQKKEYIELLKFMEKYSELPSEERAAINAEIDNRLLRQCERK